MLEHEASSDGEHVDLSGALGGALSCTSHEPHGMFLAFLMLRPLPETDLPVI